MIILDERNNARRTDNGKCTNCMRYNTPQAWCQSCDPYKATQGWTSGNKDIDDCIKGFQIKATKYEDVIEWIPFNRLDNIQNIGDVFLATWLDGVRYISEYIEFTRSRIPSCIVKLKTLTGPSDLSDMLKEVRQNTS